MSSFISLLLSILLLIAGNAFGRLARRALRIEIVSRLERLTMDCALGLGLASLTILAFGALGLYQGISRIVLLALLTAASALGLPGFLSDVYGGLQSFRKRRLSFEGLIVSVLVAVCLAAALFCALAPPAMDDWDTLAYHLAVPKLYLQHGGVYYISHSSHASFPLMWEMLSIPGLAVGSVVAAKLVGFWSGLLAVCAVVVVARKHFSVKSGPLAALGLAGIPLVLWEATTGYVDLAAALYTLCAASLMLDFLDRSRTYAPSGTGAASDRSLWLCAVMAGLGAAVKYTGLGTAAILALWLIIHELAVRRRMPWKQTAVFGVITLVACAPWYAKTVLFTGSPVYPFFYSVFGGVDWTSEMAANYAKSQAAFGQGHDLKALVLLGYNLTVNPDKFYDTPGLLVGPILLVAVPVFVLLWKHRSAKLLGVAGFFAAQVVAWFALTHQSRYLIPALATLSALLAGIIWRDEKLRLARTAVTALLALTAVVGIVTLTGLGAARYRVVLDMESQEEYLSRSLDIYEAQTYANKHLPEASGVALFGDTRGFYLDAPYFWADWGHNARSSRAFRSADQLADYLRAQGFSHALVNFTFFPSPDSASGTALRVYEAISTGRFLEVYPQQGFVRGPVLFEIRKKL